MDDRSLSTIAQVAVTLAGFSGVIFALGNRAGRALTAREESGLMHMLLTAFGPTLLAMITLVALRSGMVTDAAWRLCCGLTGTFCFTGSTKAMLDEVKGRHSLPKVLAWACPIGAWVLGITNLVVAAGFLGAWAGTILESTLIYLLWVSINYFISLLKQEHAPVP